MLYVRVCVENKCKSSQTTKKTFGKLADISTKLRQVKRIFGWKNEGMPDNIYTTSINFKANQSNYIICNKIFYNFTQKLLAMEV